MKYQIFLIFFMLGCSIVSKKETPYLLADGFPNRMLASEPSVKSCSDIINDLAQISSTPIDPKIKDDHLKWLKTRFNGQFTSAQMIIDSLSYRPAPYLNTYSIEKETLVSMANDLQLDHDLSKLKFSKLLSNEKGLSEWFLNKRGEFFYTYFKTLSPDEQSLFRYYVIKSKLYSSDYKLENQFQLYLSKNSFMHSILYNKDSDFYKSYDYRLKFWTTMISIFNLDNNITPATFFTGLTKYTNNNQLELKLPPLVDESIKEYFVTVILKRDIQTQSISDDHLAYISDYIINHSNIYKEFLILKSQLKSSPNFEPIFMQRLWNKFDGKAYTIFTEAPLNFDKIKLAMSFIDAQKNELQMTSAFKDLNQNGLLNFLITNPKHIDDFFKLIPDGKPSYYSTLEDSILAKANLSSNDMGELNLFKKYLPDLIFKYRNTQIFSFNPTVSSPLLLLKDQNEVNDVFSRAYDLAIINQKPPMNLNRWAQFLEYLPESVRYDFTYKLLQSESTTQGASEIISQLDPKTGVIEAVQDYFLAGNGAKLVYSNSSDFTADQLTSMLGDDRFKAFFPHVFDTKLEGAIRTKFILAVKSSPRNLSSPLSITWMQEKMDNEGTAPAFLEVWGFRPALNRVRLALQLRDFSNNDISKIRLRSLTVQGFYENQGLTLFQGIAGRGNAQLEDDATALITEIENDLRGETGALRNMTDFEKRIFVYQWGTLNDDAGLIDRIRNRAIYIADRVESFWNLRVEVHNFPSLDTIRRIEIFQKDLIDRNRSKEVTDQISVLVDEIKTLLGVNENRPNQFNDLLQSLPSSEDNITKLKQLSADYSEKTEFEKLELLLRLRGEFQQIKQQSTSARRSTQRLIGDRMLSTEAMAVSSKLVDSITLPKNAKNLEKMVTSIQIILEHVQMDNMLSTKQVNELNNAITNLLNDDGLKIQRKIELILNLGRNAVDQVYFDLERNYGKFDNIVHQIVDKTNKSPIRFIDGTMRSQNIFILSQLVDKMESALSLSKNITHSIQNQVYHFPVEVFNPGEAMGILRLHKNAMELTEKEIGVFTDMPSETGALAGIITLGVGARLSHLQLLAKSLKIPNAKISKDYLAILESLNDKLVRFKTTRKGELFIEEISDFSNKSRSEIKVNIPIPNHTLSRPISFKEAGNTQHKSFAGPKGMQLSKMFVNPKLSSSVPDGFILPFGFFKKYTDLIGVTPWIDTLGKVELENKNIVSFVTAQIRNLIDKNPIPQELLKEVQDELAMLAQRYPTKAKGYFFRSDTNIEDLPNFNGAGLNESVPNVTTNAKEIDLAIRTVWKSPFKEKSIYWRGLALGSPTVSVAEPSVVVMPTVEAKSSGVIISRGGEKWDPGHGYISANWGIGSVVEAGKPVEEITLESGKKLRFSFTVSNVVPVAKSGGGFLLDVVPVNVGSPVLTDSEMDQLIELANIIDKSLGDEEHGWDIEWAVEKGKVIILQARPNM